MGADRDRSPDRADGDEAVLNSRSSNRARSTQLPCSDEDEPEADPDARAKVEAHPRYLGPPFAPAVCDLSALEGILQPLHHPKIADAAPPSVTPSREVHGNVHGQHQEGGPCSRHDPDNARDSDVRRHITPGESQRESHEEHHYRPEEFFDGVSEVIQADHGIPAAHLSEEDQRHDGPSDQL